MDTAEFEEGATDPNLDMDVTDWPECVARVDNGIIRYCMNPDCWRCADDDDHDGL